jgi:anti-sigma factor RsiW
MTVHEEWTNQLSDYLDGELPAGDRGAVEAHLQSCAPCAAVLHDLQRVVARAQSVEARPPRADLWAGIANRIDTGRPAAEPGFVMPFARRDARRFTFTLPQLAAAAALLMAVSGGIAWEAAVRSPEGLRHAASAPETTPGRDAAPGSQSVAQGFSRDVPQGFSRDVPQGFSRDVAQGFSPASAFPNLADAQYDAAVADLEKALNAGRRRLDASTIAVVEHNLHIIDQAISQARDALVTDPANSYLSSHLVDARRRKLNLLRRATALTTETN